MTSLTVLRDYFEQKLPALQSRKKIPIEGFQSASDVKRTGLPDTEFIDKERVRRDNRFRFNDLNQKPESIHFAL